MSKITINAQVKLDEADYEKILDFAEKNEGAEKWLHLDKQLEEMITFNLKSLVMQIVEIDAKVKLTVPEKGKIITL